MRLVLEPYSFLKLKKTSLSLQALCLLLALCSSCDQAPQDQPAPSDQKAVADKLKDSVNSTSTSINQKIDQLNKSFNDALLASQVFIQEHQNWSADNIHAALKDIHASEALFNRAGFELKLVSIDLAINPKCILTFQQIKELDEAEQELILQEAADLKLNQLLLKTLFKAYRMDLTPYVISDINIHLSLLPKVRLNLKGQNK